MTKLRSLFLALALALFAAGAQAATSFVILTVTITNTPSDADTLTLSGNVRTWKTAVTSAGTQVAIGGSVNSCATNLFVQLASHPIAGLQFAMTATNAVRVQGISLTDSASGTWADLAASSSTVHEQRVVALPLNTYATGLRDYLASQLVSDLSDWSTNPFALGSAAMANYVNNGDVQIVLGAKTFSDPAAVWLGIVSNSPGIGGTLTRTTNGIARGLVRTNGLDTGIVFSGSNAVDSAFYFYSAAAPSTWNMKDSGSDKDADTIARFGDLNSAEFILDPTVDANGLRLARTNLSLTNLTATSTALVGTTTNYGDMSFVRYALSSLANGNNAGIVVGTNVFVEVSGPSGAFTISGIAGGRDGKLLILLNQTAQNMTIAHESGGDSTAANRIVTMTGADRATTGNGAATLIYNESAARWVLISIEQ